MRFSVANLRAGYDRALIEDLSFTLTDGECVALVGASGAGKTTVLRTLVFLIDPLAGHITLDGRSADDLGIPTWRRAVHSAAQRSFFFSGTVSEELARAASYRSASQPFDAPRVREWLERLSLADKWDEPVDTLSEGERQRVHLVRSLSIAPRVLLLDEPTSALDPQNAERFEAILDEERETRGLGLVVISHDAAQRGRLAAHEIEIAS